MPQVRDSPSESEQRTARYRNWDKESESVNTVSPFQDLIQRDPTICDHCFQTRYERDRHEWLCGDLGWLEFSQWLPLFGRNVEIPGETGTRLACQNCGRRKTKDRPLSAKRVEQYAQNIIESLELKDIKFDTGVFLYEVHQRNTSENQGKQDSHVFAPAVKKAMQAIDGQRVFDERIDT